MTPIARMHHSQFAKEPIVHSAICGLTMNIALARGDALLLTPEWKMKLLDDPTWGAVSAAFAVASTKLSHCPLSDLRTMRICRRPSCAFAPIGIAARCISRRLPTNQTHRAPCPHIARLLFAAQNLHTVDRQTASPSRAVADRALHDDVGVRRSVCGMGDARSPSTDLITSTRSAKRLRVLSLPNDGMAAGAAMQMLALMQYPCFLLL